MNKLTLRKIYKWVKISLLIYLFIGVALYFFQEKLILSPVRLPANHVYHFNQPFREVNLQVTNEKIVSIVQFTVPDSIRKGVVLYFHGNKQNIERYAPFAKNFTANRYEVWMIDYPGYGKSTGTCTEEIMYSDALEFYKMARAIFSKDSIIIYGKSLGTCIASKLASVRDCRRLILETPPYSMDALVSHYAPIYPTSLFCRYHFPINEYLQLTDVPVTIFHGTCDGLIPFSQARKLQTVRPGIELVRIEKGEHNTLDDFPLYHQKLDSLLR